MTYLGYRLPTMTNWSEIGDAKLRASKRRRSIDAARAKKGLSPVDWKEVDRKALRKLKIKASEAKRINKITLPKI